MVARPSDRRAALIEAVCPGVLKNPFIPIFPYPRQAIFLGLQEREALYGGAAGGAKTFALLADALQNMHVAKYNAVLFRRTYPEFKAAGGLPPLSQDWMGGTCATYHQGDHIWTLQSGATLSFKHLCDDTAPSMWPVVATGRGRALCTSQGRFNPLSLRQAGLDVARRGRVGPGPIWQGSAGIGRHGQVACSGYPLGNETRTQAVALNVAAMT